jgi:uncharacterized RDD family membrane protein YckC
MCEDSSLSCAQFRLVLEPFTALKDRLREGMTIISFCYGLLEKMQASTKNVLVMDARKCKSCGQDFQEWVEFCPNCAEPMEGYTRPAGFWIRVGANIIDSLVFIPIMILSRSNMYSLKSTAVLVLISLTWLTYKPFMESFYGATLGKMFCKIKVIDKKGNKLSLLSAYIRFFPFLLLASVSLTGQLILFSSPQFKSVTSSIELGEAMQESFLVVISFPVYALILLLIDCVFVAFTVRKRALHDMIAESFCVYKEP